MSTTCSGHNNDRSIKSVNGTTVIGTKKTLVFYTGRAPKGQRIDWVIHEYSATSEGLMGSNPGQGSFLLFKLMKKDDKKLDRKQDKSTEELVTPTMNALTEKLPSSSNSCLAQNYESLYDGSAVDDDLEFDQEVWRHLVDPNLEPLDSPGKIFSPLQLSWYNLCSNDMHLPISNDVGPDHNAVQSPNGTNELYMAVHLSEVLATSDEHLQVLVTSDEQTYEDSGSSKNLVVEAVQAQVCRSLQELFDPEGSSNNSNAVNNADISGPEIKLRTHQPHDQRRVENFWPRGTQRKVVPKARFRLSYPSNFRDLSYMEENHEAKVVVAKAGESEEKHNVTTDPAAIVDETQDTSLSKSNDVTTLVQEQAWIMKSGSDFPRGSDKEVPSASWIALPALHSMSSSMYMLGVFLAIRLLIVIIWVYRFGLSFEFD
ncbi:NAC domain-containing protein 62 [Camellia lanceoleosa]|uniref:NAC domain-containing protein 62 n=1 Tax=Camellia lanceoleosa TaxID=1840588 RepID=A0ACC0H6C1_9ERIC|nr:NAC domain-containing protein 62 [Camellia lanceoleosa]